MHLAATLLIAATTITSVGCGQSSTPNDAGSVSSTPLEVDVQLRNTVVGGERLEVFIRERDRACYCSRGSWPERGTCEQRSDNPQCDCTPQPAACVNSVRLERGGVTLQELGASTFSTPSWSFGVPTTTDGVEVVIDGCGGVARIPLPSNAVPPPVIHRIDSDDTNLVFSWADTDSPDALAFMHNGLWGDVCHMTDTDAAVPTLLRRDYLFAMFWAGKSTTHETPLGNARVWNGSGTDLGRLRILLDETNGVWPLELRDSVEVDIGYNGVATPWYVSQISFEFTDSEALIRMRATAGIGLGYQAGLQFDTVTTGDGYTGQFPHVPLTNAPGDAAPVRVEFDVAGITMSNGVDSFQLSLSVDVELGVIPAPL